MFRPFVGRDLNAQRGVIGDTALMEITHLPCDVTKIGKSRTTTRFSLLTPDHLRSI